jgi:hypothetical protein
MSQPRYTGAAIGYVEPLRAALLALPSVGTVVLLPVHVTYRLFSLAFLAQFDPGLDLAGLREEFHRPA